MMRKILVSVLFALVPCVVQAEDNPDLLTQMYLDSELVYCKTGECVVVDTGETWEQPDITDGVYSIAFPENKYTEQQIADSGPFISDAWRTRIEMMERDCTPPTISQKYKDMVGCQ
ncbi:hypothetical protein AVT69_gp016 [Pseudomonas phage PhiPA3]|uniref:Uncharacterized protein 016 n=1 Tax=Pseudomonas phage PhiPA3 TaxID=998086 RepID=F8SJP7_BPPA3|nr:hypothetical protein AVT69_gp016 [Pseudomonas phage PhiPA3]AEH03442.1 hypothetical protein [Pseudomonas phage PhiPA3]